MFEEKKRIGKLSSKDPREEALLSLSDTVRYLAEELANMKRAFVLEYGTEEEFDRAFNREMDRAYSKVRNMSKKEMTVRMILKLLEHKARDFDIEEEEEDA